MSDFMNESGCVCEFTDESNCSVHQHREDSPQGQIEKLQAENKRLREEIATPSKDKKEK